MSSDRACDNDSKQGDKAMSYAARILIPLLLIALVGLLLYPKAVQLRDFSRQQRALSELKSLHLSVDQYYDQHETTPLGSMDGSGPERSTLSSAWDELLVVSRCRDFLDRTSCVCGPKAWAWWQRHGRTGNPGGGDVVICIVSLCDVPLPRIVPCDVIPDRSTDLPDAVNNFAFLYADGHVEFAMRWEFSSSSTND